MSKRPNGLELGTKIAFGVGSGGESIMLVAFNTFSFIYFNQVLGLSGSLSGLVTFIALCFDAVSDPLVGSLSDRWQSKRFGRRHPFMYASCIPAALSFYALFSPPAHLGGVELFLWLVSFAVALRFSMTFFAVPHISFGSELSTDYLERTSIMSFNNLFGYLLGGGFWLLAYMWIFNATPEYPRGVLNPAGYSLFAGIGSVLLFFYLFSSAYFTRDQIPHLPQPPPHLKGIHFKDALVEAGSAFKNRNYRYLVLGLFFYSATEGVRQAMHLHVNTYFFELTSEQLAWYAISGPVGFWAAFMLTRKLNDLFDKRPTMVVSTIGLVIFGTLPVGLRLLDMYPGNGSPWLVPALVFNVGVTIFFGCVLSITVMSVLADITDEHELKTGRRQEGIFYSARTFFAKATSGVGQLLGGIGIDIIGFPSHAIPGEISQDVLFRLGILEGPVAAIPAVFAIFCYSRCRISHSHHLEVREALARRREATAGS